MRASTIEDHAAFKPKTLGASSWLQRITCVFAITAVVLLVGSGCARLFPPPVYQVNPAALEDVRSIGTVQGEGGDEIGYGDEVVVMHTFVLDVGGSSANEALQRAADLLQKHGWEALSDNRTGAAMKSAELDAYLSISPFHSEFLAHHPRILKRFKEESIDTEVFVIVNVEAYQAG